jgi:hypothetical protein
MYMLVAPSLHPLTASFLCLFLYCQLVFEHCCDLCMYVYWIQIYVRMSLSISLLPAHLFCRCICHIDMYYIYVHMLVFMCASTSQCCNAYVYLCMCICAHSFFTAHSSFEQIHFVMWLLLKTYMCMYMYVWVFNNSLSSSLSKDCHVCVFMLYIRVCLFPGCASVLAVIGTSCMYARMCVLVLPYLFIDSSYSSKSCICVQCACVRMYTSVHVCVCTQVCIYTISRLFLFINQARHPR